MISENIKKYRKAKGLSQEELAERLHNMRTIEFVDTEKQQQKAKETLEYILPVARKMGIPKLVDELNDIALKYI